MLEYVKAAFNKYAEFSGRARRSEYWYFYLFATLVGVVLSILGGEVSFIFTIAYIIFSLGTMIPFLAVTVRRLHDTGRSGWYLLIGFIPLIGAILLIYWLATEGDVGPNEYGLDPKNPTEDMSDPIHHLV